VALGNALAVGQMSPEQRTAQMAALARRADHPDALVREHVAWALEQATPLPQPNRSIA
jgi:epoxyqueuosine reductase